MSAIDVIGWVAVALCLSAYMTGRSRLFDWANLTLCVPVALPALIRGAYPSAAISLAFGVIGLVHLVRQWWVRRSLVRAYLEAIDPANPGWKMSRELARDRD